MQQVLRENVAFVLTPLFFAPCAMPRKMKKNGKVTVKKKLKKGTYSVKVKVTAAGNKNYNKVTKNVTFKVRVK